MNWEKSEKNAFEWFKNNYDNSKFLNLSNNDYNGTVEFKTTEKLPYQIIKTEKKRVMK